MIAMHCFLLGKPLKNAHDLGALIIAVTPPTLPEELNFVGVLSTDSGIKVLNNILYIVKHNLRNNTLCNNLKRYPPSWVPL